MNQLIKSDFKFESNAVPCLGMGLGKLWFRLLRSNGVISSFTILPKGN